MCVMAERDIINGIRRKLLKYRNMWIMLLLGHFFKKIQWDWEKFLSKIEKMTHPTIKDKKVTYPSLKNREKNIPLN